MGKQMSHSRVRLTAALAALTTTACVALFSAGGYGQAAGPFTQQQVDAGRQTYVESCMNCHGDTLAGTGDAVPLSGRAFMVSWGARSPKDLFDTIKAGMPVGAPGSLSDDAYTNLVAFLMHANGAASGATAPPGPGLPMSPAGSKSPMQRPPGLRLRPAGEGVRADGARARWAVWSPTPLRA